MAKRKQKKTAPVPYSLRSPDERKLLELLFRDGLRYSIAMANFSYSKLYDDLSFLTQSRDKLSQAQVYDMEVSALSHAWQAVDSVHRTRELLKAGPNMLPIGTQDTECKLFMKETEDIERLRDTVQHLDEYIYDFVRQRIPSWGTLTWVARTNDNDCCLACSIVPGEIFERITPVVNPVGKTFGMIGLITLASTKRVCLSDIVETQIPRIAGWLNKAIGLDCRKPAQSMMASMTIKLNEPVTQTNARTAQLGE